YLGGSHDDFGFGIAVDAAGNAYVTGFTQSTDFPTVNPLQATNKAAASTGNDTAFVAKLNPAGSALVYSTYLGGSGYDRGYGIAADSAGNAYVTGETLSTDFPTVNPLQASLNGGENAFVSKLNAVGSALVYSTYLGGGDDQANGIAVDSSGNAYVTGATGSTDFPTVNPLQATNKAAGGTTVFVAKLNPTGSAPVYPTYLGGSRLDYGSGIAADSAGNAYVTGFTQSTDFPTVDPFQSSYGGAEDAFVAKLNPAGSALVYSTYLGGSNEDNGFGIAVDAAGNAYVTGRTYSTDFPTVNPLQATNNAVEGTAFVTKLNPAGSALAYSTYLGGSNTDFGYAIAVDAAGSAYVTGGGGDAFVAKLSLAPAAAGLSTSSLSFGGVLVSTASPEQSVTLTDSGDFALVTTASSCPYGGGTVAPGANCAIDVTLTPTATGSRTGTVTITDNAAGSPDATGLTGAGIVCAPTGSPGS